jgi:Pentapeptide repeats (9 copies)
MFRRLALIAALALLVLPPGAPASAEDDLVRQLVNSCTGCRFPHDLRGRDLHGLHFVGADLRGVDLSRANLNGASFVGADLEDAKFDDADLRNARFTGVRFRNTSFARAKTDGIVMEGVRLDARSIVGADYKRFLRGCTGCDLREMPLSAAEGRLRGVFINPPTIPAPVISRDVERALRELQTHPIVIPSPLISAEMESALRSLRNAQGFRPLYVRPFTAVPPDLEQRLREVERQLRDIQREMRDRAPAVPATPVVPPAPPAPPVPRPS